MATVYVITETAPFTIYRTNTTDSVTECETILVAADGTEATFQEEVKLVEVRVKEFAEHAEEAAKQKQPQETEPPPWRREQWRQQGKQNRQRTSHRQIGRKKKRF